MAPVFIQVCFSFSYLLFLSIPHSMAFPVPALYVFGDSFVDSGNNNYINSTGIPQATHLPWGVDFNNTPTGRFCNGKTIADYLAIYLGLPLVPPYLGLSEDMRRNAKTGINYASSGCGILPETNVDCGCLNLDKQIELFAKTIEEDLIMPRIELDWHLAKSIFLVAVGTNDIDFRTNGSVEFAEYLLNELSVRLRRLYDLGARKFFINGLLPLGCAPDFQIAKKCDNQKNNDDVKPYHDRLPDMLFQLQGTLPGSLFSYSDNFKFYLEIVREYNYGITDTMDVCGTCSNRDQYFFFDGLHTTQAANSAFMQSCRYGLVCFPSLALFVGL